MASTTRTFIAVAVPEVLGQKLTRLQTLLAPDVPDARWSTTMPFHLTLAFLGDVDDTELVEICRVSAAAVAGLEPFPIRLEGLGVFPSPTRPRVVWVGATCPGVAPLETLQKEVVKAVRAIGRPPDDDRFHPHVTLGRLKPGRRPSPDMTPLLKHYRTWAAGSFTINEAVVYSSSFTPEGPVYAPLGRAPLKGRKAGSDT
jgi:RNA 2',3'-cyclic 3'-phosphodiesterase